MYKNKFIDFFIEVANISQFASQTIKYCFKKPFELKEFINQSISAGNKSLPLVSITALIMGLVLTIQMRPVLADLGAEVWLPSMVFVAVVREIGPVITALIFAGKVGSRIGAELSSMRVTEQIDAMEVSGTYPIRYLVATRVMATTFMLPLLVIYADFVALLGSYMALFISDNISLHLFFEEAFSWMRFSDLLPAFIKSFVFGFAIGILSSYKGYFTDKGAVGVGMATNSAVILSSLSIFIIDLIAVQITEIIL